MSQNKTLPSEEKIVCESIQDEEHYILLKSSQQKKSEKVIVNRSFKMNILKENVYIYFMTYCVCLGRIISKNNVTQLPFIVKENNVLKMRNTQKRKTIN